MANNTGKMDKQISGTLRPRRRYRQLILLTSVLIVGGIVTGSFLNRNMGSKEKPPEKSAVTQSSKTTKPSFIPGETLKDVEYCHRQLLDIYQPREVKHERTPVVMYLHGGGWTLNDKASEPDQLAMVDGLRDEGFAVVSINYRQLPTGYYPSAVEDSLCAVRFMRAKAALYGFDSDRITIYGFSAGGYLAGMVGGLPNNSEFETTEYAGFSSRVQAVATLAGIFSFTEAIDAGNRQRIANFLNGAEPDLAQAIRHVTADDPPYLLIHGTKDQFVQASQDDLMAATLTTNGVAVDRLMVVNGDHGLNPTDGELNPSKAVVQKYLHNFFMKRLQ